MRMNENPVKVKIKGGVRLHWVSDRLIYKVVKISLKISLISIKDEAKLKKSALSSQYFWLNC
jgi:hypothetical protein